MPIYNNATNDYLDYHSLQQHWSPESERYAGGDDLLVALDQGWQIAGPISCDVVWFRSPCRTRLFKVTLRRGDDILYMTVQFIDLFTAWSIRPIAPIRAATTKAAPSTVRLSRPADGRDLASRSPVCRSL